MNWQLQWINNKRAEAKSKPKGNIPDNLTLYVAQNCHLTFLLLYSIAKNIAELLKNRFYRWSIEVITITTPYYFAANEMDFNVSRSSPGKYVIVLGE